MLESRHSYDFKQDTKRGYATQSVDKGRFLNWTNDNMFRTSYGDSFCNKVPSNLKQTQHLAKSKCTAGYGGFIPKIKAENFVGRNNAELSKLALRGVGTLPPMKMSTTG